ncbi:hypothetical protein, partial [Pseudomonas aeruginosa]|uniref:hypothetical protein n=1 Tax=Pseudomonas aeruginosa TaxID=287 RepID=UPI003979A459
HSVMVIVVPIEPDKLRKKLLKLVAAANFSGGNPESEMVVSGKKKQATAKPCINCGIITHVKLMAELKVTERQ